MTRKKAPGGPAATIRKRVPLIVEEGRNRGTAAQLGRLIGNYLIRSGKAPDGREFRLFLDLNSKGLILWTEGKPDRRISLPSLIEALFAEGSPG